MRRKGVLYLGGFGATLAAALLLAGSRAGSARPRPSPVASAVAAPPAAGRAPAPATLVAAAPAAPITSAARPKAAVHRAAAPIPVAVTSEAEESGDACGPPAGRIHDRMEAAARVDVRSEGDRWARWFYGQREYPAATIPEDAMGKAYGSALSHNARKHGKSGSLATLAGAPTSSGAATREGLSAFATLPSWSALGPSQIPAGQTDENCKSSNPGADCPNFPRTTVAGRVSAIAVDPTNSDVVYVGGAQGGVWKSTDATSASPTWTPLTDPQPSLAVGTIAIDPANTDIVYVGTGEANGSCDSYYGQGILRSTDGGATWTQLAGETGGPFAGQSISKIVVDPATAGTDNATTLWASTALAFLSSGTEQCALGTGIYNGAVWRSLDSGNTWTRMDVPTGALSGPGARIHDMVIDPVSDNVLYVSVRGAPTPADAGVWRTNNARDAHPKWTLVNSGFANGATAFPGLRRINLAIANQTTPPLERTLYAAIESSSGSGLWGFYRTTSGGASWSHVDAGNHGNGKIVGTTLTRQNGPAFSAAWTGRRIILGNFVSARVSHVTNANTITLNVNFGAKPTTQTWSVAAYPDYCNGQCFYDMTVAVDPHDSTGNTLYVGGNPHSFATDVNDSHHHSHTLWVSTDGGNTWGSVSQGSAATGGIHTDDHAVAFDPNAAGRVYDGNDGGLWRSDDGGATWTDLNTNLAITQFQSVALHPFDTSLVLGGTQDNGTDYHDPNVAAPPAFFHSDDGDGGQSLIDQSTAAVYLHTYFNGSSFMGPAIDLGPFFFGTNPGEGGPSTWFFGGGYFGYGPYYYNGMDKGDRVSFYAPLAENTGSTSGLIGNNPVYFGSNRLYRSAFPVPYFFQADFGSSAWTAVSPDITRNDGADFLSAVAPFPGTIAGKEVVYTGSAEGRIEVSNQVDPTCLPPPGFPAAGTPPPAPNPPAPCVVAWSAIDDPAVLPNRFVTEIEADATDATGNTAYATFSGFNVNTPTRPGHVFVTTNGLSGAATWTDISGDLPDVPANCIALDPSTGTIYVGTDIGVFQTTDGGSHWDYDNDSFPTVAVFGLDRNANTGQIVASTHGRGMFQLVPSGP